MQDLLVLRIFDGPAPRLVNLRVFPARIGRSVFGDVVIERPGVALAHAVIERREDGFLLRDVGDGGTNVAGVRVAEYLFRENGTVGIGGVRVDVVLSDAPLAWLAPPHEAAADWSPKRVTQTAVLVIALYLAVCLVYAFKQFGDFWPPERPSEIFTEAVGIFAGLAAVSFFASLLSKLNTKRFNYVRLLTVVTAGVAWFLLLDEVADALVYNLWRGGLRAAGPPLVVLCSSAVVLASVIHALFPDWRRGRLVLATVVLVGVGYSLDAMKDHYRFEESDMHAPPVPLGLPLGDPAKGAETTAELLAKVRASIETVDGMQRKAREDIAHDDAARPAD